MLENVVAWLLNHYLDRYVENLNTDKLSVGILQGAVELENLPLKKDALQRAGLPIQITSGFIGKVKLQIPFTSIWSSPWVFVIEKLYLVAAPVKLSEWDEEAEEQAIQECKLATLAALELQWRADIEGRDGYYASTYSSWMSFGTSMITKLLENLQLHISDVHIKYEDEITLENQCFTCGVTIDSLIAESSNEKWEPGFASGNIGYKVIKLTKLSVYWDSCKKQDLIGSFEQDELIAALGREENRGKNFLLSPVSSTAHLQRNRSAEPLRSKSCPRIVCDLILDEVPLTLSDVQYTQMVVWLKGLSVVSTRARNRRFRPVTSVKENPKLWWKYGLHAILHRELVQCTWETALLRARDNVAYNKVYYKMFTNPAGALTEEEKSLKEKVEAERSLDELRALRELVKHKVKPSFSAGTSSENAAARSFLYAWFPQWWYSTPPENQPTTEQERKLEEEIFDSFNDPLDDTTFLRRDVLFGVFNFSLKSGVINLCAATDCADGTMSLKNILEFKFEKVMLGFESSPRSSSHKLTIALGSICLQDKLTADTVFPVLIAPQGRDSAPSNLEQKKGFTANLAKLLGKTNSPGLNVEEPLFQLTYEQRPFTSSVDYRLHIKTQCLDIVYNPAAINWLVDFFVKPHTNVRNAAKQKYQAIKNATKNELIKNWENLLTGDLHIRKTWDIDLDISAPQIILVEHFCDKNAVIAVLDLGRLHTTNRIEPAATPLNKTESEEEEAFQTPCSTPPGSQASVSESDPPGLQTSALNELSLHHRLYDKYTVELSEMQVLVGKVRDNWKYAHLKGSSTLHVLDKFNISLEIERRVVYTTDPQYPSLTLCGSLPKLVVHVNDQKVANLRTMAAAIGARPLSSPFRSPDMSPDDEQKTETFIDESEGSVEDSSKESAKLVLMQFTVQQMALELQSRNRSIAELQVSGVRAALTLRHYDTTLSLSVHSLLLVDALQTFGPDFELLVASHKHVGMDSVSGSIRDSEPTSPVSPGSPEPGNTLASPAALTQALSTLQRRPLSPTQYIPKPHSFITSPPSRNILISTPPPIFHPRASSPLPLDSEALISVEITLVSGACPGHEGRPLQIASIQFNNLDIIANQETIVEMLGFFRRIFPPSKAPTKRPTTIEHESEFYQYKRDSVYDDGGTNAPKVATNTELTFDFHRLNVLLLRAVVKDNVTYGRKICTATMMQAKIKATVAEKLLVEGSLGGIQVLDLTPEGQKHQRILSLGADPLATDPIASLSEGLYDYQSHAIENQALSFSVSRGLCSDSAPTDSVDVKVRMASVWYTHSPLLVLELQSCATEFKQYLTNLARSIKTAATEMAIGLVHAKAEALANSLSMSSRLPLSLYGSSTPDIGSPLKRRRSVSQSIETIGNTPYTPYSPGEDEVLDNIEIHLDVVLDTPVIILPQSYSSEQVFVAHLGKINIRNSYMSKDEWEPKWQRYNIDVRDMNLFSLDISNQATATNLTINFGTEASLPRPEKLYSGGKPILHNTVIELVIDIIDGNRSINSWDMDLDCDAANVSQVKISGKVVQALLVSLTRVQYQQVLETMNYLIQFTTPTKTATEATNQTNRRLDNIQEEGSEAMGGVSTLSLDPSVRARMLNAGGNTSKSNKQQEAASYTLQGSFELPEFTVELRGELRSVEERALVSISFRDFALMYDQNLKHITNIQMSLKSLVMEDLLADKNSKNRCLVVSSASPELRRSTGRNISQSCPDLSFHPKIRSFHSSLPDRLNSQQIMFETSGHTWKTARQHLTTNEYPCTPPPSPRATIFPVAAMSREENLVLINIMLVNKEALDYVSFHNSMDRTTTVDFNCLDVILNVESWVVVFDFFDVDTKNLNESDIKDTSFATTDEAESLLSTVYNSKTSLEVRSLNIVLIRPKYEVAKANMSYLSVKSERHGLNRHVEGKLGSLSLHDLTPHGALYRERFVTSGHQALYFIYASHDPEGEQASPPCDAELKLEMSSVVYVHTQRFLMEIYTFWKSFSLVKAVIIAMRSKTKNPSNIEPSTRLKLEINAGSPVLLLPLSSLSPEVLVADLGKLTVRNGFRRAGSEGTIASTPPEGTTTVSCLLDVMSIHLVNMDLFAAKRVASSVKGTKKNPIFEFGGLCLMREGPSLLPHKYYLKLQVDRNLDTHLSREVPDVSVKGTLATFEASLDLFQYKLIRGLLTYNIGEALSEFDCYFTTPDSLDLSLQNKSSQDQTWLFHSIHLDLVNVVVHLRHKHGEGNSLASVNFIRSRLVVETFSDHSQDIDLVSAEILITDTRYKDEPMNKRYNVFTHILQPLGMNLRHSNTNHSSNGKTGEEKRDSDDGTVQAEIHHRRRKDYSKATVLLHNMRLMAILDWWEIIRDFMVENAVVPSTSDQNPSVTNIDAHNAVSNVLASSSLGVVTKYPPVINSVTPYEFKLNITDSEIVLVEDTSVWETNAIILKSTTVISYRPGMIEKPLSCNLNHCEVFSCVLGMEEETALSIIDPVTVNMELVARPPSAESRGLEDAMVTAADRQLEVQMQQLSVRLSYHDFRMLSQMLEKVPGQTLAARNQITEQENRPANVRNQIAKLSALGFSVQDCAAALELCGGQLDDAALWLTQNATHVSSQSNSTVESRSAIAFKVIEVKLPRLRICVIDDCLDADVPLLELTLSQLVVRKEIAGGGHAKFHLGSDYYNRVLSGWEPFIESWGCQLDWEHSLTSVLSHNRLQVRIISDHLLNINITRTLMDLYTMVKNNWTQDYYNPNKIEDFNKTRRRTPFIPFAIKNDTGSALWFKTLISTPENFSEQLLLEQDESWVRVDPSATVPFSFEETGKVRHRDTHKVQVHQLAVRVDMWRPVLPVSIDKVGVFFRHASPQSNKAIHIHTLPPARIVFAVTLEGSAMKLVTVRSALIINNCLNETVEVKLENVIHIPEVWKTVIDLQVPKGEMIPVPLSHALSQMWIRPVNSQSLNRYHAFSSKCIGWSNVQMPGEVVLEMHQCHTNKDRSYRLVASIRREGYPQVLTDSWIQPAHTITLHSPVSIINHLPCELHYSVKEANIRGHVKRGETSSLHEVDMDRRLEISFSVDGFPKNGSLVLPCPIANSFQGIIKLYDINSRRLDIIAHVQVRQDAGIRIYISASYWIINKTSLPLVFKQEGTSVETAGQFQEHEVARVVAPLLFSLSDQEAGPYIQARVGNGYHPDRSPQWSQSFHLQVGGQVRRLVVAQHDSRPDIIYSIGIYIRSGKGRYRYTNIVTISPRFQIHNKSSHQLQFAQLCCTRTSGDPGASATYATAVQDCSLAWHWPKIDKELLLCVRLLLVQDCLWSCGLRIDNEDSVHINVRDRQGRMHFLRVEIVPQGATYFVVFTDADTMPPPIRIDNYSQVPITFFQSCLNAESLKWTVRPHTSVAYAWDNHPPLGSTKLTIVAPGGAAETYDINAAAEDKNISLTYENFIYIAFTATFNHIDCEPDPLDVESQQLVLGCVDGYRVVLMRKQHGERSQLWRMTIEGQLQHEGSSPPRDPRSKNNHHSENMLVLDIAGPAPQPTQCVALVLRKPDKRRSSTQTWRFSDDGRLCCAHRNMCVQAKDGFFGLRQGNNMGGHWQLWSEAVLGPVSDRLSYNQTVPMEQAVSRMKLRPGSGCLSVSISSDGPTRVLRIIDPIDSKGTTQYALVQDREWGSLTHRDSAIPEPVHRDVSELQVTVNLKYGIGISIVSRKPAEELLYISLKGIVLDTVKTPAQRTLDCTIEDIQIDNQLLETECPLVLYVTRGLRDDDGKRFLPALQLSAHKQPSNNANAHIYKHFIVTVKNFSLTVEERLLLKLWAMFGSNSRLEIEDADESDFETQRLVMEATSVHTTRYYFGVLKLAPSQVRLSVITSSKLPTQLQVIKKQLGLTLIKFEDAAVELKPFIKRHPFETAQSLMNSIFKHFKNVLKWQFPNIIVSVDFLGNPGGFLNDVTEGVSGFLYEGNVGALVKGVTHGLSNSAAKVTESLSDGLGRVTLDDNHEETRQRIRKLHSGSSGDHLVAGLKSLGFGLLGGVTSVFKQTYEGAYQEGVQGLISGFGKGLLGTVTKPVVGVLDLASETASAVRDSSRSSVKQTPTRVRLPRCVSSPRGLLPHYSEKQSKGQEYLYFFNERNYGEVLLGYEVLRSKAEDLRILISSESVRVFSPSSMSVVIKADLTNLIKCKPKVETNGPLFYVELTMKDETIMKPEQIKRPLVASDSREAAIKVSEQINYAKALYEEKRKTLVSYEIVEEYQ